MTKAANGQKEFLLRYALNDADWGRVRQSEGSRGGGWLILPFQHVEVSGGTRVSDQRMEDRLNRLMVDNEGHVESKQIETILSQEIGTGRFTSAGYDNLRTNSRRRRNARSPKLAEKLHRPAEPFVYVSPKSAR